jgi:hypothetical protein
MTTLVPDAIAPAAGEIVGVGQGCIAVVPDIPVDVPDMPEVVPLPTPDVAPLAPDVAPLAPDIAPLLTPLPVPPAGGLLPHPVTARPHASAVASERIAVPVILRAASWLVIVAPLPS